MAIGNYSPYPYGNLYGNAGNAGIGMSAPYAPADGGYRPNPYNYTQGPNFNATQPQIGAQIQQQQQAQANNSPFVMVPSREAVKDIFVAPNQTVYAMSQNVLEFYVKSVDNMGLTTIRYFKFGEFDPAVEAAQMQAQAQAQNSNPNADFLPRSEFNQFATNIAEELNSVRQMLSESPQNGIVAPAPAMAKQPTKKTSNKETTNE